jgi:putative ATP-binding cassette transporter
MQQMDVRDDASRPQAPADGEPRPSRGGVVADLASLVRALAASRHRHQVGLLAAGIVALICLNAAGQIRLNAWHGAFFDAIEQRNLATFASQLLVFGAIVGVLLVLVVTQT